MTWPEVLKQPEWENLSQSEKLQARAMWYDATILPEAQKAGYPEDEIAAHRAREITTFDTGEGYIRSFLGAAVQGGAGALTGAVQGIGALAGIPELEQAGTSAQAAVESAFPVNPAYTKTNFTANVLGNLVAGSVLPAAVGGRLLSAAAGVEGLSAAATAARLAKASETGMKLGAGGVGFLSEAGGAAQTADQYGITGADRTMAALLGGAAGAAAEMIPFGAASELKGLSRIPGMGGISETTAKAAGGFATSVATNAVEEALTQIANNATIKILAPESVTAPGFFSDVGTAAAGGAIGGAAFGALGLLGQQPAPAAPALPIPSNPTIDGGFDRAVAAGDPEAAAALTNSKLNVARKLYEVQAENIPMAIGGDITTSSGFTLPPLPVPSARPAGEVPVIIAPSPNAPQVWTVADKQFTSEAEAMAYQSTFTPGPPVPANIPTMGVPTVTTSGIEGISPAGAPPAGAPPAGAPPAGAPPAGTPPAVDPIARLRSLSEEGNTMTVVDAEGDIDRAATREKVAKLAAEANMTVEEFENARAAANVSAVNAFYESLEDGDTITWLDGNGRSNSASVKVYSDGTKIVRNTTPGPGIDDIISPGSPRFLQYASTLAVTKSGQQNNAPAIETAPPAAETPPAPIAEALPTAETAPPAAEAIPEAAAEPVPVIEDVPVIPAAVPTPIDTTAPMEEQLKQVAENKFPTPKETPEQKAERNKRESQLLEVNEAINVEEATRVLNLLKDLGATQAQIIINDNGVADPLFSNDRVRGSRGVDENGVDTVFLNRNMVTKDTAVHEALGHGAVPNMQQSNPALFEAGKALLSDSDLLNAVRGRYADEGWVYKNDSDLMEEVMAHALGNNTGKLFAALAGNPKLLQQVKIWIAKAQVWFDSFLANKGIPPGMTVEQWAKKVYTHTIAGKLKETGKARPTLELTTPAAPAAPAPAAPVAPVAPVAPAAPAAPAPATFTTQGVELSAEETAALEITKLKGVESKGDGVWFVPDNLMTAKRLRSLRNERESRYFSTPRGGRNVEIKQWSEVTGDPYAKGYAILDRRERNKGRGAVSQTPTKEPSPAAPTPTTLAEAPPAAAELPVQPTTTNEEIQRQKPRKRQDEGLQVAEPLPVPSAVGAPVAPTAPATKMKPDYLASKRTNKLPDDYEVLNAVLAYGAITRPPADLYFVRKRVQEAKNTGKPVSERDRRIVDEFANYPLETGGQSAYTTRDTRDIWNRIWAKEGERGSSPADVISSLHEKGVTGISDTDVDTLWNGIFSELKRLNERADEAGDALNTIKEKAVLAVEKGLSAKKGVVAVNAENLQPGDYLRINGRGITIESVDPGFAETDITYTVSGTSNKGPYKGAWEATQPTIVNNVFYADGYKPVSAQAAQKEIQKKAEVVWRENLADEETKAKFERPAYKTSLASVEELQRALDDLKATPQAERPANYQALGSELLAAIRSELKTQDEILAPEATPEELKVYGDKVLDDYRRTLRGMETVKPEPQTYSAEEALSRWKEQTARRTQVKSAKEAARINKAIEADAATVAKRIERAPSLARFARPEYVDAAAKTAKLKADLTAFVRDTKRSTPGYYDQKANLEDEISAAEAAELAIYDVPATPTELSNYIAAQKAGHEAFKAQFAPQVAVEAVPTAPEAAAPAEPATPDFAQSFFESFAPTPVKWDTAAQTAAKREAVISKAKKAWTPEEVAAAEKYVKEKDGAAIAGLTEQKRARVRQYAMDLLGVQDIKYSLGPPVTATQDAEYMAAVDSGDVAKQQELVDAAAKAAGYGTKAYHGTPFKKLINVFRTSGKGKTQDAGAFFSSSPEVSKTYAGQNGRLYPVFLRLPSPVEIDGKNANWGDLSQAVISGTDISVARIFGHNAFTDGIGRKLKPGGFETAIIRNIQDVGPKKVPGKQNLPVSDVYIVKDPNQIKSAEPVTYDDNGNVIPLSQRFNPTVSDVRYSLGPPVTATQDAEYMAAVDSGDVAKQQELVNAAAKTAGNDLAHRGTNPETSKDIVQFARIEEMESGISSYGKSRYVAKRSDLQEISNAEELKAWTEENYGAGYVAELNPPNIIDSAGAWDDRQFVSDVWGAMESGELTMVPGFATADGAVVFPGFDKAESADPIIRDKNGNVISLSQRFNPTVSNVRPSLGPPVTATQDAEYMAAVDSGDVAKQQRLVDAAAKASGFGIKANHTSPNKGIEVFNRRYRSEVLDMPNLVDESVIWFREGTGPARYGATQYNVFLKITDPWVAEGKLRGGENGWNRFAGIVETLAPDGNPETFVSHMKKQGWDGVKIVNVDLDLDKFTVYGVFDSNQIKSADPVTYDKNGNVIPLSQRFNPAVSDIRYSLGPPVTATQDAEYMAAVDSGDVAKQQELVDQAAKESGLPILDDSASEAFRARRTEAPKQTLRAFKLFATKPSQPGSLFPLFVGANDAVPQGVWLDAIEGKSAGITKTGKPQVKSKLGPLAFRPGWHAGDIPLATHIGIKNAEGKVFARRPNEVWAEVEMAQDVDYQEQANKSKTRDLREMPVDGAYRFKTNPNMTGTWIISGSMKIKRVLSQQEVDAILRDNGVEPMPWDGGQLILENLGLTNVAEVNKMKLGDPITYDDNGNVIPLSQRFNPTVSDVRYSLGPPNLPADSDVNLRPSGVAKNRPNSYTRGLFEGQTYQGESMQEAWDEAADIHDSLRDVSFSEKLGVLSQMKNNDYSNTNPMTPGAFAGWMLLEQRNILEDENASEADKEIARDQQQRIVDMTTDFAAEAGQKVKGFHIGIAIAEGWTTMADFLERDSIHGGAVKAKAFTDNVKAQTQILGKLTTETLSTAPAADVTRIIEQGMADVIRAEESTISGEVENELNTQDLVDRVTAQDEITSQGWFQRGLERYSKEVQADIDAWLVHMQYEDAVALLSSGASPSLSAAERSAQVLEMIKAAGITTPAQARAALPKISQETERLRGKVFGLKTETAKPAKNKKMTDAEAATMSDAEMRATILSRFDNVMNFLMNQSKVPKAKTVRDKTINAIVSGMVSKAGISVPRAKITGDQRALALGLLLQNQKLAAEMVNEIHAALEGDETTKGAWKKSNLKSLFEVYVGKGFDTPSGADAKSPPYSEKQVTQLLNAELKKLNRSLRKVVTDAALERKTPAELEAQLRNPDREFAKELSPEALNAMVNAVLAQYGKNAKQMADSVAKRKAEIADRAETRRAIAEASKQSRAKRGANYRDIRRKALRARRENVSAIREARKTGAPVPAVKPLTYQEEQELMRQRPGRVIDYLTRNFGFDLSSIVSLARAEDRKASLDDMVSKLADALGLTKAQAQLFMRPVIQEAMKSVDETRLKQVNKQIEDTAVKIGKTGIKAPKKEQKTEAQRLIDLAKLGGLNAKNVEDVMLNTLGAKKFTPEFKAYLETLIQQANNPALPPTTREKYQQTFLLEIQSARGISLLGLYGEFMMSNIFMSVLSTLKVNAVWGFIKSTADTAAYLAGQTVFKGEGGQRMSLKTASSLAQIYTRAFFGGTQNQAKYLLKTGKTPQDFENDNYAKFQSMSMEILAAFPDTEIRLFSEGKPLSPFWAKKALAISNFSKYTRRIMVATDMANRTPAMYMLRAANIARVIADKGGNKELTVEEIDSAMYGSDFKTAVDNAKKQARQEVAAGIVGADEEGIRMEEILNEGLGKSLGLSAEESTNIFKEKGEYAKRWTVANKTEGVLGVISDSLVRLVRDVPGLSALLPAIKMPIGAFSQGIDWSPVGYLRYLAIKRNGGLSNSITNALFNHDMSRKGWYVAEGKISEEQKNEMLIKASVGTALMLAIAVALEAAIDDDEDKAAFYITNRGPSDIQKNKIWREKGNAPNIMRINGVGVNFQESPAAPLLLALGAWSDAKRYGKPGDELSERLSYTFTRSMSGFLDAAVLKNLHDILATFNGANATSAASAGNLTARLVSVGLFPRLGGEINQILYGQMSKPDIEWAGKALSTVPFVPAFFDKPALNWFGESIHGSRGNALGEVLPMLAHRISPILSDDPQMLFVARMGANALTTTRRLKDGTEVAEDYDLMRKWATDSGIAVRKFLTPERMAFFEAMREKDVPTAEKAFDKAISDIRNRILSGYPQVIFRK